MGYNRSEYSMLTEKELVLLLKNDDMLAFEQIYHNYQSRLYYSVLKMVKCEENTEELVQELFVKLWIGRHNLDPDKSFKAYLFKIAENLAYDFFRKVSLNRKLEDHLVAAASNSSNNVEHYINLKESNHLLTKAIDNLPPKRKQVYILCKIEGKSYEEVSNVLGISTSTINEHIVKASRAVRKFFLLSTHIG